eukprot:scaffold6967_cov123-Isochrysis_galbana.AAC.4
MSTIANAALTVKELGSDPNTDITIFFEALGKAIGAPQAAEICKAISDALKFQYVVCTIGDLKDLSRPVIKDVFEQAKAPGGWLAFIEKALSHSFTALASMHEMNNDSGDTDGQSEPTAQARVFAPPAQGGAKIARFMGSTTLTLGLRGRGRWAIVCLAREPGSKRVRPSSADESSMQVRLRARASACGTPWPGPAHWLALLTLAWANGQSSPLLAREKCAANTLMSAAAPPYFTTTASAVHYKPLRRLSSTLEQFVAFKWSFPKKLEPLTPEALTTSTQCQPVRRARPRGATGARAGAQLHLHRALFVAGRADPLRARLRVQVASRPPSAAE